jgi:nitroreductase
MHNPENSIVKTTSLVTVANTDMNFFETIEKRRSVRKYLNEPVPRPAMEKAIEAALLAPNSSNLQPWEFYWVTDPQKKKQLVTACLDQAAAATCPCGKSAQLDFRFPLELAVNYENAYDNGLSNYPTPRAGQTFGGLASQPVGRPTHS